MIVTNKNQELHYYNFLSSKQDDIVFFTKPKFYIKKKVELKRNYRFCIIQFLFYKSWI